jgi:hypothetical protein
VSNLNVYIVTYQVHLPDPNAASDGPADLYRKAPVEVLVIAAAQDQATLSTVINNNITLAPGEVYDILQIEQVPLGDRQIYQ